MNMNFRMDGNAAIGGAKRIAMKDGVAVLKGAKPLNTVGYGAKLLARGAISEGL
jgi:hypothetical protein